MAIHMACNHEEYVWWKGYTSGGVMHVYYY